MNVTEEILQCFDEQGNPTEGRPRPVVKAKPSQYWHGISCIWVVNTLGQLLCSKRSLGEKHNPGKWQSYFGGHVQFGFSFKQTAVKELEEESGIRINEDDLFLIEAVKKPEEKLLVERFAILYPHPTIDLGSTDGEVSEVRWMKMEDHWKEQECNPDTWCSLCGPKNQQRILAWLEKKLNK